MQFRDADKPGYRDYPEKLLPLVRPGGLIVGHNVHRTAQGFAKNVGSIRWSSLSPLSDAEFLECAARDVVC